MKRLRQKLKSSRGLTLVEMVAAAGVLALLGLMLHTGLIMAQDSYNTMTGEAESQLLLSTLTDLLSNELRYARDVVTGEGGTLQRYTSVNYGRNTTLSLNENGQLEANKQRQMLSGGRRARHLLRPLDEMARATRALLERQQTFEHAPLDDERLHDLEDRIKSMRPEETLRTGDRDLRGLEEAVNSLLARLHESYQRQGQFVSDASHELRTPIAVIQGYAAMLDRWGKSDEKVLDEGIAAIKSESEYMKKLVDQLLFLARGDMGRSRLDMKLLNVSELVKEVYEDSQLIDRDHDWRIDTEENVVALADRDMLKQCCRVLCDNATKYTPAGGVIRLRARRAKDGGTAIEVQDSGIGISREDVSRVFDRFYRSDPARGRNSGGAGLGLSIARWIVESHGGHFEVLSREGIGTRFTVVLPPPKQPPQGDSQSRPPK